MKISWKLVFPIWWSLFWRMHLWGLLFMLAVLVPYSLVVDMTDSEPAPPITFEDFLMWAALIPATLVAFKLCLQLHLFTLVAFGNKIIDSSKGRTEVTLDAQIEVSSPEEKGKKK